MQNGTQHFNNIVQFSSVQSLSRVQLFGAVYIICACPSAHVHATLYAQKKIWMNTHQAANNIYLGHETGRG